MFWISVLLALLIAWIWVDYYRLIDVYHENKLIYFIFIFGLGLFTPLLVSGAHALFLDDLGFVPNGNALNDFMYYALVVGALEELSKLIPFLIFYVIFKSQLKEPIDYVAFMATSTLGFAASENILYMDIHGIAVIKLRSILPTVLHMFCSALIAYGIILYKFHHKKNSALVLLAFFALSSLTHGFYDFWLIFEPAKGWGFLVAIIFFFLIISWFATILNNAINNSSFFSYKKSLILMRLLNDY